MRQRWQDSRFMRGLMGSRAGQGIVPPPVPRRWDGKLAQVVSQAFSPLTLAVAMVLWVAALADVRGAWMWGAIYVAIGIVVPLAYLLYLVRRRRVTDVNVFLRAQRVRPLQVTLAAGMVAWLVLLLGGAPGLLVLVTGALEVIGVLNYLVTLRWKISMHTTIAAAATTFAWTMTGLAFPLLGVPLMAWSRVRLGRHTAAQTAAGGAAGFLVFFGVRLLAGRYSA